MQINRLVASGILVLGLAVSSFQVLYAGQADSRDSAAGDPWIEALSGAVDPMLEKQMHEVQDALRTVDQQIIQRERALAETQDPAETTALSGDLDVLKEERENLKALMDVLVEDAQASEWTDVDAALERDRWLELQREYEERKEEAIRDRQS